MAADNSSIPPVHSRSPNGTALYEKECPACGKVSIVDKRKLGKRCLSCANKARSTHGLAARGKMHPLYRVLKNIEARCNCPTATHYEYYGGRGISVCSEWSSNPPVFIEWALANGWKPGLEIDRKDSSGNYAPDNCRVVSHRENSQRTRRIKTTPEQARLVKDQVRAGRSVKDAAHIAGVSYMVAWHIKNNPDVWGNV